MSRAVEFQSVQGAFQGKMRMLRNVDADAKMGKALLVK
jgi:hypothetical protein